MRDEQDLFQAYFFLLLLLFFVFSFTDMVFLLLGLC